MKFTAQTQPAFARRDVHRSARAFTLLEVMIAAMVMTLTITSSLEVLQRGLQAIDTARYSTLAGQILQSQMEKLRLLSSTQLQPIVTGHAASFTPDLVQTVAGASSQVSKFTCNQTLSYDPAYANSTMIDITLTATWTSLDGTQHTRTYYSQYAQHGISDFFYSH
jgi:type II secretory pathway pseudopilin PulG